MFSASLFLLRICAPKPVARMKPGRPGQLLRFPPGINLTKLVSIKPIKTIQTPGAAYFQLQFGCELLPVKVSCCWCVPSASMVQICRPPARLDWKTICRPSGDHDG